MLFLDSKNFEEPDMQKKNAITCIAGFSALLWIIHALISSLVTQTGTFGEYLITGIPLDALIFRLILIIAVTIACLYVSKSRSFRVGETEQIEIDIPVGIQKIAESDPEFLKNFFHKIKTQLNNIFGFADLIHSKEAHNGEADRYFGYIESSKQSVMAAIDEMVSVLKMGKIKPWKKGDDYLEIINWDGKKILIAEDVQTNFILLKAVLEKTGAEIIHAENGMEAVKLFRRNRDIDLILMDILMPEMDGFEATKTIRKINTQVPIIAQTAYNFDWTAIQKEGLGFNDYLAKPIGHYDLILKAYRYLEK